VACDFERQARVVLVKAAGDGLVEGSMPLTMDL